MNESNTMENTENNQMETASDFSASAGSRWAMEYIAMAEGEVNRLGMPDGETLESLALQYAAKGEQSDRDAIKIYFENIEESRGGSRSQL